MKTVSEESLMKTVSEEESNPSQTSKNKFEPERPFVQCMQYVSHCDHEEK